MAADVYYYIRNNTLVYTNDQYAPAASLYEWDPDHPISRGWQIFIELVDGKFIFPEDATGLFYGCSNEVFNDMEYGDTTGCTNMAYLFAECRNLKNSGEYFNPVTNITEPGGFSFYGFNTEDVTDMSHMFENCLEIENLRGVSSFDTSKVTDMSWMFGVTDDYETTNSITEIGVTNGDTSSCTNMEGMFCKCGSIESGIPVGQFDTSNVTNMSEMFKESRGDLDVSGFKTSNCTNMRGMFSGTDCDIIDVSSFDTSNADCTAMFSGTLAREITLGEFDLSSTQMVDGMFNSAFNLETVTAAPGTDWTLYHGDGVERPFYGCEKITNWDGDITLTHANNTKEGGYFGVGKKTWTKYVVFMKV